MSICPKCNGAGVIVLDNGRKAKCNFCFGRGMTDRLLEQTNEEWFTSLSTEEKAKWLSRNSKFMYGCGRMETTPKIMYEEDWEWWLKEKHE